MAIPIVPYTITKLCRAASKKSKSIHCQCNDCSRSGKYRKSIFQRVRSIFTYLCFYGLKLLHIIYFHLWDLIRNSDLCLFVSLILQISNVSTYNNLTLLLLWVIMIILVYYIKSMSSEVNNRLLNWISWFHCMRFEFSIDGCCVCCITFHLFAECSNGMWCVLRFLV